MSASGILWLEMDFCIVTNRRLSRGGMIQFFKNWILKGGGQNGLGKCLFCRMSGSLGQDARLAYAQHLK